MATITGEIGPNSTSNHLGIRLGLLVGDGGRDDDGPAASSLASSQCAALSWQESRSRGRLPCAAPDVLIEARTIPPNV
jgi:hypothetical protein